MNHKPLLFCNKVTTGFWDRGKPLAVVCAEVETDVITMTLWMPPSTYQNLNLMTHTVNNHKVT